VHTVEKTMRWIKKTTGIFDGLDELYNHAKLFGADRTTRAGYRCENVVFNGRLPWQPAGIKFIPCVSGQKSTFSPLQEKLCVGSKND